MAEPINVGSCNISGAVRAPPFLSVGGILGHALSEYFEIRDLGHAISCTVASNLGLKIKFRTKNIEIK